MGLSLKKFKDNILDFGSRVYDQANPFDSGLSFTTRSVDKPKSVLSQAADIVRPTVQQVSRAATQVYETPLGRPFGPSRSQQIETLAKRNPRFADDIRSMGYKNLLGDAGFGQDDSSGTLFRKSFSDIAGTAANFVPVGKAVQAAKPGFAPGAKALAQTANKAGMFGAGASALGTLRDSTDPKELLKSAAIGYGLGASLPVAGRVAGKGAQLTGKVGTKLTPRNTKYSTAARTAGLDQVPNVEVNSLKERPLAERYTADARPDIINRKIDDLTDYEGAPDLRRVQAYKNQIARGEKVRPIIVRRDSTNKLGVEDGKHRLQAYRELGYSEVPTKVESNLPPIPDNISDRTRIAIESVRTKNAPAITEGTPSTDTSIVKGAPKRPAPTLEDEFKIASAEGRSQTPKGNVGNYQYTKPQVTPKDRLGIKQTLSPDRLIRENITRPLVQKVQKGLFDASISENPIARGVSKLAQGVGKETALPQEILDARRQLFGQGEFGKVVGADARALSKDFDTPSLERVYATLDPEQAARVGIAPEALTPEENVFREKLVALRDERTQGLAERGIITPEQAANENYIRRAYSVFEDAPEVKKAYENSRKNMLNTLKSRKVDIPNDVLESAITDPGYLIGKNYAEYQQAIAVHDFVKNIADQGYVSDTVRPGFTQLPKSKMFGENAGKYVPKTVADDITGFQYTSGTMNALNDLLTAYDQLGIRKAKKAILTIFNPAVRVGNQLTNRVIFSQLNGINPLIFNKNMLAARGMIKNRDPIYTEAVKQGLFNTDITRADFGTNVLKYTDDNTAKKALQWFGKSYSGADDRAKLAAFKSHLDEGYSVEEAGRLTQRGFQDYNSVGFFYDLAAKTPLIGNAFVRFAGDANRIISNAFIDHPIRTIGTGVVWANLVNMMSKVSGETPEDKETREGRFGAPHIPFTDISLTVQTPMGEINLARFVPMYALNDVSGGDVKRFLPFQGDPTKPQNFNDPLLGQFGQIATDTDFRGKSIADPLNTIFDRQTYNDTQGQAGAKFSRETNPEKVGGVDKDIAGFLAAQNIPLGREANAIVSAIKGGPDVLGKERTLPQALQRAAGIKIEQFGPEQAEKQRNTNAFFEGNIKRTNEFLKANPDLKSAYYRFNNSTRDRATNTKVSDLVTPERWRILNSDKSGRLYEFLKSESLMQNKENGKPVDPVFSLNNPSRIKEVLELRSRPTGDDIEREEILRATTNWYKPFERAEREYYEANSKFYASRPKSENPAQENARVAEYRNVPHAEQSPLIAQYYQAKAQGEQVGKDFFKANADKLSADFQAYKDARLKEINAKRAIEGYDPIDQDTFNNVTFGYEDDERKVARELYYKLGGYGGGKGRGSKSGGSVYKYAIDPQAGGEVAKPKVSVKEGVKTVAKKANIKQPKVSLKKSRV